MKFIAVSTNKRDVSEYLPEETKRIEELREAGTLTDVWVKADFSGAFLVFECADEAEALAAVNSLPIAINKATDVTLTAVIGG